MWNHVRAVVDRLPEAGSLLVASLAGVAGVAASYGVAAFTPSFIAGPIAGQMARRLPGPVITFAIVVLGDLGEQLNVIGAVGIAVGLLAGAAFLGTVAGGRFEAPVAGPIAAVLGSLLALAVTGAPIPSLATGVAAGVVVLAADVIPAPVEGGPVGRRQLLGSAAGAFALAGVGIAAGDRGGIYGDAGLHGRTADATVDASTDDEMERSVDSLLAEADEKSLDVDGIEPLVSEEFYEVDINATDPVIDAEEWELTVTGAVAQQRSYSYEEITDMDATNRFVTLRCVGESLNGKKMDTAVWTGIPIWDLVEPAIPADECCVMLRAADGFFEEFPLSALRNGMLAYGMNGQALPGGHGYPARALIPGHWGEINVKWITEIEVLREEQDGYWEQRGWHGTGPVETVAKLHAVNDLGDGRTRVGGHAYAGTRGIETVEVSTDGGDTWVEAALSEPLPGEDVWRQWSHSYDHPGVEHEVVVRAVDGNGDLQPEDETDAFPSGPTGWVSRTVE